MARMGIFSMSNGSNLKRTLQSGVWAKDWSSPERLSIHHLCYDAKGLVSVIRTFGKGARRHKDTIQLLVRFPPFLCVNIDSGEFTVHLRPPVPSTAQLENLSL
jgi:hypothetical protein